MREGLTRFRWTLAAFVLASAVWAQNVVTYLNGVPYVFPSAQGAANKLLTNDGAGTLTWASPPSPEGLWTGSQVLSTVACPSGWTHVSAADGRALRGSGASGGIGGADMHVHSSISGVAGSATSSLTGSTAGSSVGITGSSAETSVSHSHGTSTGGTGAGGSPPALGAWTGVTVLSSDPGHSHGSGTLAGSSHSHAAGTLALGSHGHGVGTLATASGSSLAAYYGLIICQKD